MSRQFLNIFCSRTYRSGVCRNDSLQVVTADREAIDSIWSTVVLLCQVTWLDVWSGHNNGTEIHKAR